MNNIQLPEKFNSIISTNSELNGALLSVMSEFSDWLTDNKTEFFPEYTCHGFPHIQSVLDATADLITEESLNILTPQDVYVLTSAVLLHDCAMHLSRPALWNLLTEDVYNGVLLGFSNEKEWSARWEVFKHKVKRFEDTDWHQFFGEYRDVKFPEIGDTSLSDNQKILIGDFVRQFHACIAQVISVHGLPSSEGPLHLFNKKFTHLNELAGFIARSHNHSLREATDLLGDDRKREYRNTHPTFLMGILRIADYLQFKSERTPKILFKTKSFCSPISIREWKKHLSIISTSDSHPDEELIFVEAFPEDAGTLVGIKSMLQGLQKELDEFWAVSGEVHSRYPKLKKTGIIYRRVKSNIDSPSDYVSRNHKNYHPYLLTISSENQKLFPLLIKPLYGNQPQVGIRELLQNATDACLERHYLNNPHTTLLDRIDFNVRITINANDNLIIIEDDGIGMNTNIVEKFFLRIGASFRSSEMWKSQYTSADKSYIPRTGKFGVGMLAGFLLGHKIEVESKHESDNHRAIKFKYELDSKDIELRYIQKKDVGTKITVHSNTEIIRILINSFTKGIDHSPDSYYRYEEERKTSWWFFFDTPHVSVKIVNETNESELEPPFKIKKQELPTHWNSIDSNMIDGIWWRFDTRRFVFCNGVMIKGLAAPEIFINSSVGKLTFKKIQLCILDNNGHFPLNLTRNGLLTDDFLELEKIEASVKAKLVYFIKSNLRKTSLSTKVILNSFYEYSKIIASNPYSNSNTNFPMIFSRRKSATHENHALNNSDELVLHDFVYQSQKRGVIYSPNADITIKNLAYTATLEARKDVDTIYRGVALILFGITFSESYSIATVFERKVATALINENAWFFVKEYDLNKASTLQEIEMLKIVSLHDDWAVITSKSNDKPIPTESNEVFENIPSNCFSFALYKPLKAEVESELSNLVNI